MSTPSLDDNINQIAPPGGASIGTISSTPIPCASNLNTANGERTIYRIDEDTLKTMHQKLDGEIEVTGNHVEKIREIIKNDAQLQLKWKMRAIGVLAVVAIVFFIAAIFANPLFLIGFALTLASGHFINALEERMNGAKRAEHQGIYSRLSSHSNNLVAQRTSITTAEQLWKENPSSQKIGDFQSYAKRFSHRPFTPERLNSICDYFQRHLTIEKHEKRLKELDKLIKDGTDYWAISVNAQDASVLKGKIDIGNAFLERFEGQLMQS